MGTLFALLSSAMWGTSDFLGGTASRRLSSIAVVAISELFGLVGVVVVALSLGSFGSRTGYLGWGVLGGLAGALALMAFYRALATGTMGVVAPIASLGVIVPLAVGLGQGDRPHALQGVGIVVAVAGVALAGGPELRAGDGTRAAAAQPLVLAVVAAAGFGVVFVALDHGARTSTVMTLVVMRGVSVVFMLAVAGVSGWGQLRVGARNLPLLAVVGGFDIGANATFAYASRHGLLSLVSVLSSLYPAVTVVLARTVHAERLRRVQLAGVLSALVGVALIASAGTS